MEGGGRQTVDLRLGLRRMAESGLAVEGVAEGRMVLANLLSTSSRLASLRANPQGVGVDTLAGVAGVRLPLCCAIR